MSHNRVMLTAVSSGSGKTTITCGILQALMNRKLNVASFKCGPDYIDPMFHSKVIGTKSKNLDSYFNDDNTLKYLMAKSLDDIDISVIEGVMGFYDGLAGTKTKASSYDVAKITETPAILVVNCKGMSLSILPIIKGFMEYKANNNIKGVILNQMSSMIYGEIKALIEEELNIKVLGYVPKLDNLTLESRHLGLVTPDEITDIKEKLKKLANTLEETLDIDGIINLSKEANELTYTDIDVPKLNSNPKIAVAYDEAFCFYYEDNFNLLKEMGASIEFFSPLNDSKMPDGISGIILGGGYPELYAKRLSENKCMLEEIKKAIDNKMPTIAECGGFMYLNESMQGNDEVFYNMVGAISGESFKTPKLNRFGYIELESLEDNFLLKKGEKVLAHEFHYWDSTNCGEGFKAQKPFRKRNWNCINVTDNLFAGYPHIQYYSNINMAYNFIKACEKFGEMEK